MILGALIDALKVVPSDRLVVFDFCNVIPTTIDSWRGDYSHLAIGWRAPDYEAPPPTAEQFVKLLEGAIGQTVTGYKGGDYVVKRERKVWADNYGTSTCTAIVGVEDDGYYHAVMRTQKQEYAP